jgi:hypothetical protein
VTSPKRGPFSLKIGLTQTPPTSRDRNCHAAAFLREKCVTLVNFVGYTALNKKLFPGMTISMTPPQFPGSIIQFTARNMKK